jgi:hypothetical protein
LFELIKRNEIGVNENNQKQLLENIRKQILKCNFDYKLFANPKVLNVPELKTKIDNKISSELLNKIISRSKFTILDSLFRVLRAVNKEKTINALNTADSNIFVQSMCHKELNISQTLEVLFRAKSKTYINENLNSDLFWYNLLDDYLFLQKENQYQYHRLNFGDFLKAFEFCIKINSEIAYKHFETDFLKKLKLSHKSLKISSLFQFLRKLELKTNNKYNNEILDFLELNKSKFIDGIKNGDLQKTTSGLVELSKCHNFRDYVDDLIYITRKVLSYKISRIKGNEKIEKKIYSDLKIIGTKNSNILLKNFELFR